MTTAAKTANEMLLSQNIRHQISLAQYSNKVVTDVLSLLNAADKELTAKLAIRLEAGKDNWTSRRMQSLIKEISTINAENYGAAAKLLKTEMVELAGVEAGVAVKSLIDVQLSKSERIAINSYTTRQYSRINEFLRTGNVRDADKHEAALETIAELEKMLTRSTTLQPMSLYRGVSGVDYSKLKVGESFTEKAFSSTSFDESVARTFAGNGGTVFEISVPAGGKAFIIGEGGFGNHEQEVLLAANSEYKITAINGNRISMSLQPADVPVGTQVIFSITQPTSEMLATIVTTEAITLGPDGAELLDDIFKTLAAGKEARIRQAIRMGMSEGESIPDLVKRLIGTRAARFTDGILERDRRAAEGIVRTAVNHVSNKAADMTYRQNGDLISGVQWVITLDTRSCLTCVKNAQGGKPYKMDEGPRPPVHVNDRCFMVPVMKSWKELGIDLEEMPISGRAAMTGVEAGDMTYGDWLRKYPEHATEALGPARAKLFQEGKIKVENFVSDRGKLLTLDELRAK